MNDKLKFFALYLDCTFEYTDNSGTWRKPIEFHESDIIYIQNEKYKATLLLRPLSSITDEEAIEVAKLASAYFNSKGKIEVYIGGLGHKCVSWGDSYQDKFAIESGNIEWINLKIGDYLRSRGFALPYMNYSVEKLIELGWIKLVQ